MDARNASKHDRNNPHGNTVINCKTTPSTIKTVTVFPGGEDRRSFVLYSVGVGMARMFWLEGAR